MEQQESRDAAGRTCDRSKAAAILPAVCDASDRANRGAFVLAGLEGLLDYAEALGDEPLKSAISRAGVVAAGFVLKARTELERVRARLHNGAAA